MFQSISCRLCINICNGHQRLYDADGLENEVYQLTEKYFTPMLLNMERRSKHLTVICLDCWRHISEFHTFQQSVLLAQRQLVEVVESRTEGPSLDEEQFSSSPPETLGNVVPHGNELRCAEVDTYDNEVLTNTTLLRDRINVSSNYKATPQQSEIEGLLDKDDFRTNPAQSIVTDLPPANECRSGEVDTYGSEIVKLYTAPTFFQDRGNVSLDAEDSMESSDDQDEEWEEFEEPVGIFAGGEFDNNENEINETVNRSGSDLSVEQFSSVDKMSLPEGADRTKDKTNAKKDYPEKVKNNTAHLATEIGGSAQSKSERTPSKDTSGKRIRNSALETMSESEWSDGGFSSDDDIPLIVLTRQGKVLAERDNPKEVGGKAKNTPQATIAKSNSNITCKRQTIQSCKENLKHHKTVLELTVQPRQNITEEKSSNSKEEDDNLEKENNKGRSQSKEYLRQPKPALEFDVSDFETCSSSDSELPLADSGIRGNPEDVQPINGKMQNKTKRRRQFRYGNELNRPRTAEEFDEFISKWIPNLECVICGDSSPCFTSLSQHFEKCHPNEKCHIVCCQHKFYRRYEIGKHILYHNTPRDFKCGVCYKCFTTKYLLGEHMQQKHSGKVNEILKCPKCQKTYYSKQGLGRHLKYNNDCDNLLIQKNQKQRFTCSECGKDFKSRKILNTHKRRAHLGKRKEFTCTVCDKVYSIASKLREHMVVHTGGEDIYTCWYCPQTFRRTADMYWHARLEHPKERDERIKKKLVKASTKNTCHKCTICENVYRTPFALKEHMATHAGKNLYACLYCPNTYKYSSNLCAHMKRIHPNDYKKKKDDVDDLIKKYKLKAHDKINV